MASECREVVYGVCLLTLLESAMARSSTEIRERMSGVLEPSSERDGRTVSPTKCV